MDEKEKHSKLGYQRISSPLFGYLLTAVVIPGLLADGIRLVLGSWR